MWLSTSVACKYFLYFQVQDVEFLQDGTEFFTCNDIVARDSADRNIMGWDFSSGVLLSNQIFQVTLPVLLQVVF